MRNAEGGEVETCPQLECLRGRDGRDGRDGGKGEKGEVGPRGEEGDRGEMGPQGTKGIPGPQGPVGTSGPQGAVGEKGDRGDPGLPGPQGEQGAQGPPTGGAVYTRWGRTSCPSGQETELVYAGRAAGTRYNIRGGGSNILCLPNDPQYFQFKPGVTGWGPLIGVDYSVESGQPLGHLDLNNMPCAVCHTTVRESVLMIPAHTQCPGNWTIEYSGYLMTAHHGNAGRLPYKCVDKAGESTTGGTGTPCYLHHVEPDCSDLSCPPYDAQKELACVVCTH